VVSGEVEDVARCFVNSHELASTIQIITMLALAANNKKQRSHNQTVVKFFLSVTFLWAFLATFDGPTTNVGVDAGSVVYITAKSLDRVHVTQLDSLWKGMFPEAPQRIHASFLLFDFKQNLRRWPNVAGDISRSPPLYTL
jgi:hypothetical protein